MCFGLLLGSKTKTRIVYDRLMPSLVLILIWKMFHNTSKGIWLVMLNSDAPKKTYIAFKVTN